MENVWPLLVAAGISVVLSLLRKKPESPPELPEESPWAGLLEEEPSLEPVKEVETAGGLETGAERRAAYYAYEEEEPEDEVWEDVRKTVAASVEEEDGAAARIGLEERQEPVPEARPVDALFPGGFDARQAVLYAEILRPKFREEENRP